MRDECDWLSCVMCSRILRVWMTLIASRRLEQDRLVGLCWFSIRWPNITMPWRFWTNRRWCKQWLLISAEIFRVLLDNFFQLKRNFLLRWFVTSEPYIFQLKSFSLILFAANRFIRLACLVRSKVLRGWSRLIRERQRALSFSSWHVAGRGKTWNHVRSLNWRQLFTATGASEAVIQAFPLFQFLDSQRTAAHWSVSACRCRYDVFLNWRKVLVFFSLNFLQDARRRVGLLTLHYVQDLINYGCG